MSSSPEGQAERTAMGLAGQAAHNSMQRRQKIFMMMAAGVFGILGVVLMFIFTQATSNEEL